MLDICNQTSKPEEAHKKKKKPTIRSRSGKQNKKKNPPHTDARSETGFATTTKTRITPPLAGFFLPASPTTVPAAC
jgi:hypothetical protein